MKDRIEKYVRKHRDDFDILEPDAALWNRIETRLEQKSASRNMSWIWKAAAILVLFGLTFWAQMKMDKPAQVVINNNHRSQDSTIAEAKDPSEEPGVAQQQDLKLLPEFAETEKYYSRKVNSTMKELKVYLTKYPDVASDMKKDIAELDSVYKALKHDLGDNVAQEEILSAMIQNYRMKLRILEDIKNELIQNSSVKPIEKNNSHDI